MNAQNSGKTALTWAQRDAGQKLSIVMLIALWLCIGAAIGWVAYTSVSQGEDPLRIGISTAAFSGWLWTIYNWSKRDAR